MKPDDKQEIPAIRKTRKGPPILEVEYSKTSHKLPGGYVRDSYTATFRFKNTTWSTPLDAQILGAIMGLCAVDKELPETGDFALRDSDSLRVTQVRSPLDALMAAEHAKEQTALLETILRRASPRELAVVASLSQDVTLAEIARKLQIKPSTARVLLHRLRQKIPTPLRARKNL